MALRELLNGQAGNPRKGQRFRNVVRDGQQVHDYANGPDQVVGPAAATAMQVGGHGQEAQPFAPAGSIAELLKGAGAYEQEHGDGGMVGEHLHDAGGQAPGTNSLGAKFAQVQVGDRKFHVYFSQGGERLVREIKKQPTFTPTPAA